MNSHFVHSTIVLTSVESTSPEVRSTKSQLSTQDIAKQQFIDHLARVFKPLTPIWLKIGQDRFFYAELLPDGSDLAIYPTSGNSDDKKIYRNKVFNSDWFIDQCEQRDGGHSISQGNPKNSIPKITLKLLTIFG